MLTIEQTERVRGFSLETHAVATLCNPKGMPRPFWASFYASRRHAGLTMSQFPALEHDIRKIPSQAKSSRRRSSSSQVSPQSASTGRTSVSATSASERPTSSGFSAPPGSSSATSAPDLLESPSLSIFKKKRKSRSRREHPLRKEISEASSANHQRYWNEFDDGDEGSEDEAYTIFVDPNASSPFPGSATIAKIFHNLVAGTKASTKKVRSWLNATAKHRTPERQHLIEEEDFISQASAEDNTDLNDNDSSPTHLPRHRRHYSTISTGPSQHALKMRETLLFRACIASFTASFTLLIIASILAGTGRKKAVMTVDLGVVVGVIASLVFAVVAVGAMIARTDRLGWMHRVTVVVLFALDCMGCAMLGLVLGSV